MEGTAPARSVGPDDGAPPRAGRPELGAVGELGASVDLDAVHALEAAVRRELLARRDDGGVWRGRLSSSALSTALATFCLAEADRLRPAGDPPRHDAAVDAGLRWLATHANPDGGFGDTVRSRSNLPTTLLAWAALHGCREGGAVSPPTLAAVDRALAASAAWIGERAGGLAPDRLEAAILDLYGEDRTFSVPILTFCTLAGVLDEGAWKRMPRLPFELAVLPRGLFRWVGLPVVSYALPALIAIGRVQHRRRPGGLVGRRRELLLPAAMRRLEAILPGSGGFLEAIPLTAFVTVSLLHSGAADHPVTRSCLDFLAGTLRPGAPEGAPDDSGWPIDVELATWVTTLAIDGLGRADALGELDPAERRTMRRWLLDQQWRRVHPFTGAAPGGWAWTDLPGGVPDADDTPGALVALHALEAADPEPADATGSRETLAAVEAGLGWLLGLQNRDGGFPTFCRGWAKLPFDRSTPDLTAHALRAFAAWVDRVGPRLRRRIERSRRRALDYLAREQRPDGSWLPLWFGNEAVADNANPVYGTARVLRALEVGADPGTEGMERRGVAFLLGTRTADGGWGGGRGAPPTVEETALALDALAPRAAAGGSELRSAVAAGLAWLVRARESADPIPPTPIGFYFANLWYSEELYPLVFQESALGGVLRAGARAPVPVGGGDSPPLPAALPRP